MKSKVIRLFNYTHVVEKKGVKYSALLEQFVAPFTSNFQDVEFYEDIFEFAINAWNFGNMKLILPEGGSDVAINALKGQEINLDLLKRMIDYKVSHFKEHTNFIADYEITETSGDPILKVIAQEKGAFLANMLERLETEDAEDDFEENYISKNSISYSYYRA